MSSKWEFGEFLVLICLTMCYATGGGLVYCLGLMQSTWIDKLNLTNSEASIINSATFAVTLLPAPLVQALRDYFNIQPYIVFSSAATFVSIGLYLTSAASTFRTLLISNGIIFSVGIVFSVTGTLTTVYHYFLDDKITLVSACVSSGMGMGMIAVSMSFKYMEPIIGWQNFGKFEFIFLISYILAVITFFPPMSRLLGVRTRKCKEEELEERRKNALLNDDNCEEKPIFQSKDTDLAKALTGSGLLPPSNDDQQSSSSSESSKKSVCTTLKNLLTNPLFLLLLFSWVCNEATYNAVMVHQPERVVLMGYSLGNGADTLAINGAVQIVARFSVGLIAERGLISVVRLSQISKFILGSFSIISNFFPSLLFQTIFMFLVGICGGIVSTTDVILIKDCLTEGRELGISILLLMDGLSSMISIAGAGFLYTQFQSYHFVFCILGASSLTAFVLVVLLEVLMKRNRSDTIHYTPL
ncbi:uncharacterized protein LOC142344244 [Convolutriloba macropyga]|uniref:uncharacterized protein LOC142344244 n=1 Tax=Convolutriloba macropyga TaxID=536237 RepID=UPI003F523526